MKVSIRPDKILAGLIVGLFVWAYIHHDYAKWNALGLDIFLRAQHSRFERYMNPPQWSIPTLLGALLISALVLGLYELIAAFISNYLMKRSSRILRRV